MKQPKVTIICPCYNEERFIVECIESILRQDYPAHLVEHIFVDGGSTDGTTQLIRQFTDRGVSIQLLHNPKRIVPVSMNMGIRQAHGDYIIRIDAHAQYPTNYISRLIEWSLNLPDAANVGTPCVTQPREKTPKGIAIAEALSCRFGVGNSQFRVGTSSLRRVDTVPFGCFPRAVFDRYGLYDERFVRMQDLELNKRIIRNGGAIYLIPDCTCTYFARSTYNSLVKTHYGTGKWNMMAIKLTGHFSSLSLRHYIPMIFVITLPLCLAPYLIADTLISLSKSLHKKISFPHLWLSFLLLHISHGAGQIAGLLTTHKKANSH